MSGSVKALSVIVAGKNEKNLCHCYAIFTLILRHDIM